eukprot:TCONS_00005679-protein
MAVFMHMNEREAILDYVYNSYNTEDELGLLPNQLQEIYRDIRNVTLNLPQIKASVEYICACPPLCDKEEVIDVLKEMERRFYLAQDLQWEFAMLDRQRKGAIPRKDAMFLFQMVHGEFFSKFRFEKLMNSRPIVHSDVSFEEIEVDLCNIPTYEWIDELMIENDKEKRELEFLRKENERKAREAEEAKRQEEKMKREMDEEDVKFKEMLEKKKQEKLLNEKKRLLEEEEALKAQKAKMEEEERQKAEQSRLEAEQAEQSRLEAEEAEQARLETEQAEQAKLEAEQAEQARLETEKAEQARLETEQAKQAKLEAEQAEQARLEAEKAEQARIDAEQAEQARLDAEKAEQERLKAEQAKQEEGKEVKKERAAQNWTKAKKVAREEIRKERKKHMHKVKATFDAEEASRQSLNAEQALEAEHAAEAEMERAQQQMAEANTEEEKEKAQQAGQKAKKTALKHKEKRLRSTLKAAIKLRNKPRIDAGVEEAKEALPEIPALKPDIEDAETVSDSIQCGNELDDAMARRDLEGIESSVDKIKKKKYEEDHAERLLEADKLANKLRRLEKLKKDIMALDQRTISEIRSYKKPLPAIHDVMIATYVILGYKEKELKDWKYIQALLGRTGKEGLKRQCTTLDATTINQAAAALAESKYLKKHDLETVTDISAGAATFFVWSTAMIEENRSWHEDSEFREKLEEKKRQEAEEAKRLEEQKRIKTASRSNIGQRQRKKSEGKERKKSDGRERKKSGDGKKQGTSAVAATEKKKNDLSAKAPGSPKMARSKSKSPGPQRRNIKPGDNSRTNRGKSKSPSRKPK